MTLLSPLGVVLAGGRSTRMGDDKATLLFSGQRLVDRAARCFAGAGFDFVVADGGRQLIADAESLTDGEGSGPVAGILGAAAAHPDQALLVLACDMPYVPPELITTLAVWRHEADWVVPRTPQGLQPLCARYGPRAVARLAHRAQSGEYALHDLDDEPTLVVDHVESDVVARFGRPDHIFRNLNRPEDVASLTET